MRRLAALGVCVLLAACGRAEVNSGLSERDANEMAAFVNDAGMHPTKSSKDGKTWTLSVPTGEANQATALLQAAGYPRDKFESLGDVFKKQGFVSSPVEEHARLIYGLSQELSNTISYMEGVVTARVLVVLPEDDPFSEVRTPSSASVLVRYDPAVDLTSQIGSIKSLVVNGVEGLSYDRVTVVLTPARPVTARTPPSSSKMALLGITLAGAVMIGGLEIWRRRSRSLKRV